jgi:hypothetical protein
MAGGVVMGMALAVLASSPPARAGGGRPATSRFIRMATEDAGRAARLGVKPARSIDYGTFSWQEVSAEQVELLRGAGVIHDEPPAPFALRLGEVTFDPLVAEPDFGEGWSASRAAGRGLHLVQYAGPPKGEWLAGLRAGGLGVVQYVHPFTYIVAADAADLPAARAGEFVRWTGPFHPAYRVLPQWRNLPDQPVDARILLVRDLDSRAAVAELERLGAKIDSVAALPGPLDVAAVVLSGAAFRQAAALAAVYSIQVQPTDGGLRGEMSNQVNVNNVDGSNLAFPGYLAYLSGLGLSGAGVIIANVDGGVQETHPNLVNRFIACAGATCSGTSSNHGTHTAGIMAADGSSGVLDGFGFQRGLGMAPGASLVEQVYSPFFTQPGGMLLLMYDSARNGASLSGNSWGPAGSPRGYDADTRLVDIGVRDTDSGTAGDQPLSYVLSFMNGNGGFQTQGTPDEGKNLFTIGSTKMQNSGTGSQILQIDDLSPNTAHGPALDGRTIPHMVAPGCNVDSTYPTNSYSLLCGTSMASPHVSGAVALFIQSYRALPTYTVDPSPALVKAAFLAAARSLAGHLDADGGLLGQPFDSKQGWGRMDTAAVIAPATSVAYFDNPMIFDNTGEQWTRTVSAADPGRPLRLMLVWTDAPGHGLGGATPAWNNDLDLVVEAGPDTYRGNNFNASGWSQAGGAADFRNNTEGVFIGPTAPGSYNVRVIASNLSSDALPNQGDTTDQDFAVVCYNCALDPAFTLTANPSPVSICAPTNAAYNINVGQLLGFSTPVNLSVTGQPDDTSAMFSPSTVTPPGTSTLTIGQTDFGTPGTYNLTITGTAGAMTRTAGVVLKLYGAAPAAVPLTAPANGAANQPLRPTLTWTSPAQAATHEVQIATDPGFNNVVAAASGLEATSFQPPANLATGTVHYWRVRSTNPCGTGPYSAVFSFTTRNIPAILLVDDDDNSPDVRSYYTNALNSLGREYDIWDTANTDNEPSAVQLAPYSIVVWFSGDEFGGFCGPGSAGEAALAAWLNTGRCLFISSQDYLYDRGGTGHNVPTAFMQTYLGVLNPGTSDVNQTSVTGAGLYAGFGPYTLTYPFSNFSDRISPDPTAQLAFTGNAGNAAISKNNGVYRTVFLGFPLEAIPTAVDRAAVLSRGLDICNPPCPTVRGDLTGTDGVNADDIAGFTRCYLGGQPAAPGCSCADMDANGIFTEADIAQFVDALLAPGGP